MTVAIPSVAPLCRLHAVRGDPGGTHGTFTTPLFVTVKTGRGRASVQQQRVEWAVVQSLHFGELRGNVQKWLLLPQVLPLTGTRTLSTPRPAAGSRALQTLQFGPRGQEEGVPPPWGVALLPGGLRATPPPPPPGQGGGVACSLLVVLPSAPLSLYTRLLACPSPHGNTGSHSCR